MKKSIIVSWCRGVTSWRPDISSPLESVRWLTVVEAVLQFPIDLDHVVGTADDFRFHILNLVLNIRAVGDVKLGPVGTEVGVSDRRWDGQHAAGTNASGYEWIR